MSMWFGVTATSGCLICASLAGGQCVPRAAFPAPFFPSAGGAYAVELGDVNGDGLADAVVTGDSTPKLAVHLRRADGSFDLGIGYSNSGGGRALAVGDLDADGLDDVVLGARSEGFVAVMLSEGDGQLADPTFHSLAANSVGVALGDLDGDGDLDIAASGGDDGLIVLRNDGAAHFTKETGASGAISSCCIALADLDDDGDLDVAAANLDLPFLHVYLNEGAGSFAAAVLYETPEPLYWLCVNDLNSDGHADVAAVSYDGDAVSVFLGNGDGSFADAADYAIVRGARCITVGDMDGDGWQDLLISCDDSYFDPALCVLPGVGDGTFEPYVPNPMSKPRGMAVLDYNEDGHSDVLLAHYLQYGAYLTIALNRGDGSLLDAALFDGFSGQHLVIADADGDGWDDFITASTWPGLGGRLFIYRRSDEGQYDYAGFATCPLEEPQIVAGDVDKDGDADIFAFEPGVPELYLYLSEQGALADPVIVDAVQHVTAPLLADLDGEGGPELVVPRMFDQLLEVARNDGAGSFSAWIDIPVDVRVNSFALEDVDGDGDRDVLAVGTRPQGYLSLATNLSGGVFAAPQRFAAGTDPLGLAVGDIDGDGWLDAFLRNGSEGEAASILMNDGAGGFGAAIPLLIPFARATGHVLADFNADGYADLAFAGESDPDDPFFSDCTPMLFGKGDGTFSQPYLFRSIAEAAQLDVADLDRDGDLDLVVQRSGEAALLDNLCAAVCPGDVDGDGATGQPDLGLLLASYELPPDDPFFDPRADLNGDGEVDQSDLGILLADYGCGG